MANRVKVKGIKFDGQPIKMPEGLAELLENPNEWVPYKPIEKSYFEETSFYRNGKRVTQVRLAKEQKQYA